MFFTPTENSHPEITLVGTVGPSPDGVDFDAGWKFAGALKVPIVDEHYYQSPEWFLSHLGRYDGYDRAKSKVYIGEYASRGTSLFNALSEAAYMTGLERNGDVVRMASYAPLLGKVGHTQWDPDLIYFNNQTVSPTANYFVQQLFSRNAGDRCLPAQWEGDSKDLATSAVRDTKTGDLILKLVNTSNAPKPLQIAIRGSKPVSGSALVSVLTGNPAAKNEPDAGQTVQPKSSAMVVASSFEFEAPASSLSVIRIPAR